MALIYPWEDLTCTANFPPEQFGSFDVQIVYDISFNAGVFGSLLLFFLVEVKDESVTF
jgi:hypothetical protein